MERRHRGRRTAGDEAVWERLPGTRAPVYGIDERPGTWWESLLYGWQHTLVDVSPFVLPLALAGALGMDAAASARLISFCLMAMAVATLLQTTIGNRLPIVQGPSAILTGALVPVAGQFGAGAMWGAVVAGAAVETAVGALGLLRWLRRLFPPAVSGVVVMTIGLSLGELAARMSIGAGRGRDLAFAGATVALIVLLQVGARRPLGGLVARGAIFLVIWTVGLGAGSLLGEVDWALVAGRPWLALPRLFPYGGPGFGWELAAGAVAGALVGYAGSVVESIGDYAATAAAAGERLTVRHLNRGIFSEGLGCLAAACLGGMPCTSYTQNVGVIATTGVASRHVVRIAAGILFLYGLCPKFGALLVAMPRAVLGGVFVVVCGTIVVAGMRLAGAAGPAGETTVDRLVIGTTLVASLGVPAYARFVLGAEWLDRLPALARLAATSPVVLAVVLAVGLNLVLGVLLGGGERDDAGG